MDILLIRTKPLDMTDEKFSYKKISIHVIVKEFKERNLFLFFIAHGQEIN